MLSLSIIDDVVVDFDDVDDGVDVDVATLCIDDFDDEKTMNQRHRHFPEAEREREVVS